MKQLNCLIIDDEPLARKGLKEYCSQVSFLNVIALCKNALQGNEYLKQYPIDIIFLDINMPLISGLDWLKTLEKSPLIIMTTAYEKYALESFSYEVVDYLVKPISFERFLQSANKVYRLTRTSKAEQVIFIKDNQSLKKVAVKDILFLEAMQNYVKIYTINETITTHSTLKQLKENLPKQQFIQTHKSFVVSKVHVSEIKDNHVLISEHRIPVSTRKMKEVFGVVWRIRKNLKHD